MFLRTLYFVVILIATLSCQQKGSFEIDSDKLKELQGEGVTVIDIRTIEEYRQGHIPGVLHIDYQRDDFLIRMDSLEKGNPIVIHCASGGRSGRAIPSLMDAGFGTIYDYAGGFSDWMKKGEKIEK